MNIIITAHGHLASSMLESIEMIMGPLVGKVICIDFEASESLEGITNRIRKEMDELSNVVFCDLKGGTPFNATFLLSKEYPIQIITGMNLGMMLESLMALLLQDQENVLEIAKKAGIESIYTIPAKEG